MTGANSHELGLPGVHVLTMARHEDERGSFAHRVDVEILERLGLDARTAYVGEAVNHRAGTVRGLHWQDPPYAEAKTLWCTRGSLFDVLVDLRPGTPTYRSWISIALTEDEPLALHVPAGVAHGYQTTANDTWVGYLISIPFEPSSARALRWDDPSLAIPWPLPVSLVSDRDREAPLLDEVAP